MVDPRNFGFFGYDVASVRPSVRQTSGTRNFFTGHYWVFIKQGILKTSKYKRIFFFLICRTTREEKEKKKTVSRAGDE